MFSYQPLSDEELSSPPTLLDEGEYVFRVKQAVAQISKSGNPMIKLTLQLLSPDGTKVLSTLTDYLVADDKAAWKIKKFALAVNEEDTYYQGTFNEKHCANKIGRCFVKIFDARDTLPKRNGINTYLAYDANSLPAPVVQEAATAAVNDLLDDLPF